MWLLITTVVLFPSCLPQNDWYSYSNAPPCSLLLPKKYKNIQLQLCLPQRRSELATAFEITHQSHFHCSSRQAYRYLVSFSLECSSLAAFGCLRISTLKPFSKIAAASPMISTDESSATVGPPLAELHQQPNQAVAPKGRCGTWALSLVGGGSSFALDRRVWLHDVHLDKLVQMGDVTPTARILNLASKFRKQRTQNLP